MIGYSYFFFEGITNVLPILNASEIQVHNNFHIILAFALFSLWFVYTLFGLVSFYDHGGVQMKIAIVEYYHKNNKTLYHILEFLFCSNLILSYPLVIFPVNQIID